MRGFRGNEGGRGNCGNGRGRTRGNLWCYWARNKLRCYVVVGALQGSGWCALGAGGRVWDVGGGWFGTLMCRTSHKA